MIEDSHLDGRGESAEGAKDEEGPETQPPGVVVRGEPPAPAEVGEPQHSGEEERPDDVELLLDGERPGVLERGRHGGLREVAGARGDGVPIGEVEQGGDAVHGEVRDGAVRAHDDLLDGHRRHDTEQGRQQPAGTPGPEAPEPDAS